MNWKEYLKEELKGKIPHTKNTPMDELKVQIWNIFGTETDKRWGNDLNFSKKNRIEIKGKNNNTTSIEIMLDRYIGKPFHKKLKERGFKVKRTSEKIIIEKG